MKKVIIAVLALFCLSTPTAIHAQGAERIQHYDSDIAIKKDGTVAVSERIEYFFDSPRHGIYRNIPVVKTNDSGKKYGMTLSDVSVTDEQGTGYTFTRSRSDGDVVLKIGDANRTITGMHTYVISYIVSGALTYFPGHDELYWNTVGSGWEVPVTSAVTTVTLPQEIPAADLQTKCDVCTISGNDTSVEFRATRPLAPHEGMTFVLGFPKGIVAVLEPTELVPFFSTIAGKITLFALGVAAFLWYILAPFLVIRNWWKYGRDPKPAMGVVSAWFSPPKTKDLRELSPTETGSLIDEQVDMRDIYAALVDLARRGYMKIIERKDDTFFFEKQKEWAGEKDILPFENKLLGAIFEAKKKVKLEDLDLIQTFAEVKRDLYTSLVSDGYFAKNPQQVRTAYYILAFFALASGNLMLFLIAFIFGRHMPRKTLSGAQAAAEGKSLKNFLVSQKLPLKFQAQKQMMFEKLLPYAVAFGVEEIWAKRFADLNLKQPDWYVSSSGRVFNTVVFAHALGRSAAVSFASSVTMKSSTGFHSGFGGGGGFSGGGGGGGGGGSW